MTAVRLVDLSIAGVSALADGDLERAGELAGIAVTPYFIGAEGRWLWEFRRDQLAADPAAIDWIARAVVDADSGAVVGFAGFHGPPDRTGMVEVGYSIDPDRRRRGYAGAALDVLIDRARRDPTVRHLRATISPSNRVSQWLVLGRGFIEMGQQWDEIDGIETIYELAVDGD